MWISKKSRIDAPDGRRPYKPLVVPAGGATPSQEKSAHKDREPSLWKRGGLVGTLAGRVVRTKAKADEGLPL